MTIEEYAQAQAEISARLAKEALVIVQQFLAPRMSNSLWLQMLKLLFPFVARRREESARLAREFYDSQREEHYPDLPTHPVFLAEYELDWFVESMEYTRSQFSKPGASEHSAIRVVGAAMKVVEDGGRRTILRPVEDENPEVRDDKVLGWARVATGRETCEFCLTLVSRGPVYRTRESAGGDKEFHPFCDCKVVPVFDKRAWPGRSEYLKALEVWKKYSKLVAQNPELRKPQNGNQRGPNDRKWSMSEATMAAIRRALYSGEIKPGSWSIAA